MNKKRDLFLPILGAISICFMVLLLFSHTYNDIVITTRHGINFWNILFDGDILHFFERNYIASGNDYYNVVQGCAYNILLYIIFAVWNIPLALISAFTDVEVMNNLFCIAYAKLLTVAAMAVSAMILCRILKLLNIPEKQQNVFLFLYLTSTLMISVVFVISQYDLISVVFQLLGVQAFLEKKDRKFIFWFGIAFCLKYFSLILFLPLLLLCQKRIFTVLKSFFGMLLPLIITSVPFMNSYDRFASELTGDLLSTLFNYANSGYSLFVVLYCVLLVWCFLQEDEEKLPRNTVWVAFVAYGLFFSLLDGYLYWAIMFAPFIVLVMTLMPQYLYLNLLLETVGLAGLIMGNMFRYSHFFFGDTMKSMLMSHLVSDAALNYEGSLIYHLIRQFSAKSWVFPVCNSLFIAAIAIMAFLSYPQRHAISRSGWQLNPECREALLLRLCVTGGICLLPILSLFI